MFDIRDHGGPFGGGGLTKGDIFPISTFGLPIVENRMGTSFQNSFYPQINLSNKKLALLTLPGSTGSGVNIYDDGVSTGLVLFDNALRGCIPLSDGRYVVINNPNNAYIRDSNLQPIPGLTNYLVLSASQFQIAYEINNKLVLINSFFQCFIINLQNWTLEFNGYVSGRPTAFTSNSLPALWDTMGNTAYLMYYSGSSYKIKIELTEVPTMTVSPATFGNYYREACTIKPDGSEMYVWNINSQKCEVWDTSTWVKVREFALQYRAGATFTITNAPSIYMLKYLKSEDALLLITPEAAVLVNPLNGTAFKSVGVLKSALETGYGVRRVDHFSKKDDSFYAIGSYTANSTYYREFLTIAATVKVKK